MDGDTDPLALERLADNGELTGVGCRGWLGAISRQSSAFQGPLPPGDINRATKKGFLLVLFSNAFQIFT